jgi:hypothetical protein
MRNNLSRRGKRERREDEDGGESDVDEICGAAGVAKPFTSTTAETSPDAEAATIFASAADSVAAVSIVAVRDIIADASEGVPAREVCNGKTVTAAVSFSPVFFEAMRFSSRDAFITSPTAARQNANGQTVSTQAIAPAKNPAERASPSATPGNVTVKIPTTMPMLTSEMKNHFRHAIRAETSSEP